MELNLSRDEKQWLSGKIEIIEPMVGCKVDCISCGADAPYIIGDNKLSWTDFEKISESVAEIKGREGVDLLTPGRVLLDRRSEPTAYSSEGRSIKDIIEKLSKTNDTESSLTISGWDPNDEFRESAMYNLAELARLNHNLISFVYSVKTVGKFARDQWDVFMDSIGWPNDTSLFTTYGDEFSRFLAENKYTKRLEQNINTLSGSGVRYIMQYVKNSNLLPDEFKRYASLFNQSTVLAIYKNASKNMRDKKKYNCSQPVEFGGVGRAVTDCGIPKTEIGKDIDRYLVDGADPNLDIKDVYVGDPRKNVGKKYGLFAEIRPGARLFIMFGLQRSLYSTEVSLEFLKARSEYFFDRDKEKSRMYGMLAELQGRRLVN